MQMLKLWKIGVARLRPRTLIVLPVVVIGLLSWLWLRMPSSGLVATYYPNPDWRDAPVFSNIEKEISLTTFDRLVAEGRMPAQQSNVAWNGWSQEELEVYDYWGIKEQDERGAVQYALRTGKQQGIQEGIQQGIGNRPEDVGKGIGCDNDYGMHRSDR